MKSKSDPRHQKRIKIIQFLYSLYFNREQSLNPIIDLEVKNIVDQIKIKETEINQLINQYTVSFSSEKMAKIDLAILQLAIYELKFQNQTPQKVIIDESVELAKEFGNNNSPKFINGLLGKIIEND